MQEIWKDIEGYKGSYQVSNLGKVRSLTRKVKSYHGYRTIKGKILKPLKSNTGYYRVDLKSNQHDNYQFIHRLVALAFIPNPHNFPNINHKDSNPLNNSFDNLEWCSQSYNIKYAYIKGNAKPTAGCFKKGSVPHNRKRINQYDLEHNYLNSFDSVRLAALHINNNIATSNIFNCLNGHANTAYGYIWEYADE